MTGAEPPFIVVTVAAPGTSGLDVVVAHAPPPLALGTFGPTYDPTRRDDALVQLRDMLEDSMATQRPALLLGDLNLTDRELAYDDLTEGLTDSYHAAGTGLSHTWRPPHTELPFGLLRIDMALSGPGLIPVSSLPDCAARGADHCILDVELAVGPSR